MTGTIVVGIDDSPSAREAERVARHLSDLLGTDIAYVRVPAGVHPADGLVAAARETEAALIVVGSTGPRSSLLGSVSADVSRRAPCPVVVVPPDAADSLTEHAGAVAVAGGLARLHLGARATAG